MVERLYCIFDMEWWTTCLYQLCVEFFTHCCRRKRTSHGLETATIDTLKPDKQVQLKKSSIGRLIGYFLTADYAEGEVLKM